MFLLENIRSLMVVPSKFQSQIRLKILTARIKTALPYEWQTDTKYYTHLGGCVFFISTVGCLVLPAPASRIKETKVNLNIVVLKHCVLEFDLD
jgi:hypothetical protein